MKGVMNCLKSTTNYYRKMNGLKELKSYPTCFICNDQFISKAKLVKHLQKHSKQQLVNNLSKFYTVKC